MSAPIVMRRGGSGSCIPKVTPDFEVAPLVYGAATKWALAAPQQPQSVADVSGIAVFVYARRSDATSGLTDWVIQVYHKPNRLSLATQDFDLFADEVGMPSEEREALRNDIRGALWPNYPFGTPDAGGVMWAPMVATHHVLRKRGRQGLKWAVSPSPARPGSLALHVTKQMFLIQVEITEMTWDVEMDVDASGYRSRNRATEFFERLSSVGSDASGAAVSDVPAADGAWLSPWPEGSLGFVTVKGEETMWPGLRVLTYPLSLSSASDGVYVFGGDVTRTAQAYGFPDGTLSREAQNVSPENPAQWYRFLGADKMLPDPADVDDAYRPGIYYAQNGKIVLLHLGHVLRQSAPDVPLTLEGPSDQGVFYHATDAEGRSLEAVYSPRESLSGTLAWEEWAVAEEEVTLGTLRFGVATGGPTPPPKDGNTAMVATFYIGTSEVIVVPQGGAPAPTAEIEGEHVRVTVPLSPLLEEADADHWLPYQTRTVSYQVKSYVSGDFRFYPGTLRKGEATAAPSTSFVRYSPFPVVGL